MITFELTYFKHILFRNFFCNRCGHCKSMVGAWEELAKKYSDNKAVEIAKVDCAKYGSFCNKKKVSIIVM